MRIWRKGLVLDEISLGEEFEGVSFACIPFHMEVIDFSVLSIVCFGFLFLPLQPNHSSFVYLFLFAISCFLSFGWTGCHRSITAQSCRPETSVGVQCSISCVFFLQSTNSSNRLLELRVPRTHIRYIWFYTRTHIPNVITKLDHAGCDRKFLMWSTKGK